MTRNTKEMCQWLRDNSSGVYRPSAEAADLIEALTKENARLAVILDMSVEAMEKARNTTGWDRMPYNLHLALDDLFKALSAK